jgi:hypothetical protein
MTTMAAMFGALPLVLSRHRLGAAAPARHHDCWRLDHEPDAHALHHAGGLPLFGSFYSVNLVLEQPQRKTVATNNVESIGIFMVAGAILSIVAT